MELSPFAFSQLLAHQTQGVPDARIRVGEDVWAFPSLENTVARSPAIDKAVMKPGSGRTVLGPRTVVTDSRAETVTNSIGMKLKLIPAGEFQMGSTEGDDEKPRHLVTISRPFYLGVYPVTQREYMQIARKNPSHFSSGDRLPVENVSWFDAVAFCNALSQKEGLKPFYAINGQSVEVPDWNGPGYRLPTEAEWEYACRAGTTTRFSFGDDENASGPICMVFTRTPAARPTPSVRRSRTPSACMTCTATSGSGAGTGMMRVTTLSRPRKIPGGLMGPRTGCSGAGAGATTRGTRGRRTASGSCRGTGTDSWASAWPEFKEIVELQWHVGYTGEVPSPE